jgi:S-DNA-T family DNA segregation ATPase FtsK/SpoIIIE
MVPIILVGAVLAAAAATWFGYPGFVLLIVGVVFAAFSAPPTVLTGKKDISGFPTAASPAETKGMNSYRMWGELKGRLLYPSTDWLPGWPLRLWWFATLFLSVAVAAIPTPETGDWGRLANAIAVFVTINTTNGALRRWTAPDDLSPGPTADALIALLKSGTKWIVGVAAVVVLGIATFLATLITVNASDISPLLMPLMPWHLALAAALTAIATGAALISRPASLATWRTLVRVRAEWEPRWQMTKLDPSPRLIAHDEVGPIQIDTFESHPTVGSAMVLGLLPKVQMAMGAATRLAFLESPALDTQGQPVEGSKHPLRFRILTFNTDDMPDITDPAVDMAQAELLVAASASWTLNGLGASTWVFLGLEPLHKTGEDAAEGGTAAWVSYFAQPEGPDAKYMRENALGEMGGNVGGEAISDHKSNELYLGALLGDTTDFRDPKMKKHIADLALTDEWAARWSNILKMGAVQPRPEHAVYAEAKVGNVKLYRQPFVVQQGMDPLEFYKLEPKIRTTLSAAPFVSVTGFNASGDRPGERHGQAFCVTWAAEPVPSNPDKLAPGGPGEGTGPRWVLSGRINEAFDAARLARPEIADVKPLTDAKSRGHIWEIKLRLYGGVTLAEVRGNAQKLRQSLGSKWLRVADAPDGCIIVAGVDPKNTRDVVFARPEKRNRDYVTSLDWEQAFSDASVVGSGGILPKLIRTDVMPTNEQVQVLDFKLPTGTDRTMVKGAVSKLQTGTGNAFVEVRPSPDGADHVRILVSREHPLPNTAAVDWAAVDASDGILYFATGVEGEPVGFNPKNDPHILCAGASGGGKSVLLQVLLYSIAALGYEIYVIDPTKGGADFQFVKPYAKAFASNVDEAAAVMKAVYVEVVRRKDLNAAHGVGSYRDLPDSVRPKHIFVCMDEFTSLMQPDPVSKTPSDDPEVEVERELGIAANRRKGYIGTMAGKIAREARSAGVTLILATQKLSAKMLDDIPGAGDLKTNLARTLMGNATFGEKQSALKNAMEAPEMGDVIPKGRGLWESTEGNARLIQVWFEGSQTVLAEKLAERREPLAEDEKLDLTPFMDKAASSGDDQPIRRPIAPAFPVAEPEIVTVADFEFTLDDLDVDDDDVVEELPAADDEPMDFPQLIDAPTPFEVPALAPALPAPEPELDWSSMNEPTSHAAAAPAIADADLDWSALMAMDDSEPAAEPDFDHIELHEAPAAAWSPVPAIAQDSTPAAALDLSDVSTVVLLAPDQPLPHDIDPTFPVIALPATRTDESDLYGWWKIDAAIQATETLPALARIIWIDPELAAEDEIGVPHGEVVLDVFDYGVAVELVVPTASVVLDAGVEEPVYVPAGPPVLVDEFDFDTPAPRALPVAVDDWEADEAPEAPEAVVVVATESAMPAPEPAPAQAADKPKPVAKKRPRPRAAPEAATADTFDEPGAAGPARTVFDDLF